MVLWALLAPLSGCLFEGDRAAGRLSVRLDFAAPEGAPAEVEWWLYDVSSGCGLVDTGKEAAHEQGAVVRFQNLQPGIYTLYVQATDSELLWQSGCAGLVLDRFEEFYACEVYPAPDGMTLGEGDRCGDRAWADGGLGGESAPAADAG